ncbi:MAG: hypothetical protein JNK89_11030, partial [Saprospiraceae bacterium]|nr:hypothetical protein [Saprospiraceae bacterium]
MIHVRVGRSGGLGCLIFGVLALVLGYYVLKGFFFLLWWAAPALFVLALIINWRAVWDTGRSIGTWIQRHPVSSILLGLLALVGTGLLNTGFPALNQLGYWITQGGFPLLALYLLLRALGYRQIEQWRQHMQTPPPSAPEDEYVEFEEIESRPADTPPPDDAPLEPPPPEAPKTQAKPENPYDD